MHAVYSWNNVENTDLCVSSDSLNVLFSVISTLCFCWFFFVQLFSHVQFFATLLTVAHPASLLFTSSWWTHEPLLIAQSPVHWLSDAIQPSHPLRPLLLPSIFLSIGVFFNKSVLCGGWPNWSFSFSISPSNECSGLISFRIDWFDLLAVQGILKSLLQHHGSKASILQPSAFFMVQLSYTYMTTEKP